MNWSKAKNVLILAFLITNTLLIYGIFSDRFTEDTSGISDLKFYSNVEQMLLTRNIHVLAEVPKHIPNMNKVTISYELFRDDKIAESFFDEYTKREIEDELFYVSGLEELSIVNNKELYYINNKDSKTYTELYDEKLFQIADDFLKKRELYDENVKKIFIKKVGKSYKLLYTKEIEGYAYEESYMKFDIDSRGVHKFERLWIDVVEKDVQTQTRLTDPSEALLRLMYQETVRNLDVLDISPCYYFGGNRNNIIDYKNAKKGEAVPVWRIVLSDGNKYFFELE